MPVKFPCSKCNRAVAKNHRAIQCDSCNQWIHIKCNKISETQYLKLCQEDNNDHFICIVCLNANIPFSNESNESLLLTTLKGLNIDSSIATIDISLNKQDKDLINHISNLILQSSTDPDNNTENNFCKYYTIDQFSNAKFNSKNKFSVLH